MNAGIFSIDDKRAPVNEVDAVAMWVAADSLEHGAKDSYLRNALLTANTPNLLVQVKRRLDASPPGALTSCVRSLYDRAMSARNLGAFRPPPSPPI